MKKSFIILMVAANFLALNAQNVLLFDFSTKQPALSTWGGGTTAAIVDDASSLGNKVGKVTFTQAKKTGPVLMTTSPQEMYSSSAYAGFTMKVKSDIPADPGLIFTFTIENGSASRGNWSTFPVYTGNGGWVTMEFPFLDWSTGDIDFDRICLNMTTHGTEIPSGSEIYFDDVTLVTSFTPTGMETAQADNHKIISKDGIVAIQGIKNNTDVKIYTALGALVYNAQQHTDFSIDLREYGVSSGILFVNLNDGAVQTTKKILYAK